MAKDLNMITIIPLSECIDTVMKSESKYIPVANVCESYTKKLNSGVSAEELCEDFISDFSKVANHDSAKQCLWAVNEAFNEHKNDVAIVKNIKKLYRGSFSYAVPNIENVLVEYMCNKNDETRSNAKSVLELFSNSKEVSEILEALQFDAYEERSGKKLANATLNVKPEPIKTYSEAEVNAIVEQKLSEQKSELEAKKVSKTASDIDTHINLHGMIKNIMEGAKRNNKVMAVCEQYMNELNKGRAQELLFEDFVSAISPWNYLSAVDTQVSALKDRIEKYKQDIDLKKILETMKETGSYYIVPLIEDCIVDYVNNKNMTTLAVLRQRLSPFEHDVFVRDIINALNYDQDKKCNVYLGESLEQINNYVDVEKVYSPLYFVKESECVFNVKGRYYSRRGNSISKLSKSEVSMLPDSFMNLCNIINNSNVVVNEELNTITVYDNKDVAVISESAITINKQKVAEKDLQSMAETSFMMRENKEGFYNVVNIINENFNDIARIDFVKRVASKDGSKSVDVFKLNKKIFINMIDESMGTTTFMRNVNPIQCKNHINEHMEVNIESLFEDVLPEQKQIEEEIASTKTKYEDYLKELHDRKDTLEKMLADGENTEDIDAAIKDVEDEIANTEDEFKKYKEDSDKYMNGTGDDDPVDPTDEPSDEPAADADAPAEETPVEGGEETEQEMTEPIENNFDDTSVPEYDPTFDATVTDADDSKFQILKVAYNKNVKADKVSNKGEVFIMIPSVDSNGDIHNDTKKVTFYVDNGNPVINNEYMPLDMYNAIKTAILEDPNTSKVDYSEKVPTENVITSDEPAFNADSIFGDDAEGTVFDFPGTTSVTVTETPDGGENPADEPAPETTDEPIDEPSEETPAETEDKTETSVSGRSIYPIDVNVDKSDLRPMKDGAFEAMLDECKIKHDALEGLNNCVHFRVENDNQVRALRERMKCSKGWQTPHFNSFFYELANCGNCVKEGVSVINCFGINESAILNKNAKGSVHVTLPNNPTFAKMFGADRSKNGFIELITESYDETRELYEKLAEYCYNTNNADADARQFVEAHKSDFSEIYEHYTPYEIQVPYSNVLAQKLKAKGIATSQMNENMSIYVKTDDSIKAKTVLNKFYGANKPKSVNDFIADINEGVVITVKDDTTGKTVTIDTGNLDADKPADEQEMTPDFNSSFENTTFDPKESALFDDPKEDSDEGEDKKDKKDEKDDKKGEKNESEETSEGTDEESKKDAPKKKFVFKKKSKKNESMESLDCVKNALNESNISVYDTVIMKDGNKGQVICEYSDGRYIVSCCGRTVECSDKDMTLVGEKSDMEMPYKFDMKTLKGLFEQMVHCGMFMNGIQITPNGSYTKYSDYLNAKDDDNIRLVVEGESTLVQKKYVRILEDVNAFANINDYKIAKCSESEILVNMCDMCNESIDEARCLVNLNSDDCKLVVINKREISVEK